jgi:uncharacterized protein YndB with AHSA1/START domain
VGFGEGVVVADKIEREIEIGVPIDHVWGLVVQPGWWVDADQAAVGDWSISATTVVTYDEHQYPVRVESVDPAAHRVTFRWASTFPDDDITDGNSTLIEFTLTDLGGTTRVRMVESGFAGLDASEEVAQGGYDGNDHGWGEELEKLRVRAEAA